MFFTSIITPINLLVLYVTFLADVYRDSILLGLPQEIVLPDKMINGCVGGQLFSSLLAVSCVTVAFCSNFLMVTDKVSGARSDLMMSPVKSSTMALGYYIAATLCTLIVCYAAMGLCFVYLAINGWYLSVLDVLLIAVDVVLLVTFGTALSSVIHYFLTSQGQISAVGTIVSSGYGFICGAYMPISQFGSGLQTVLSFFPGTYGTALLKSHAIRGVLAQMREMGVPNESILELKRAMDGSFTFMGTEVQAGCMFVVVLIWIIGLLGVYVCLHHREKRVKK